MHRRIHYIPVTHLNTFYPDTLVQDRLQKHYLIAKVKDEVDNMYMVG